LACLFAVLTEDTRASKIQHIENILTGTCAISCIEKLKDQQTCDNFCEFVPHVLEEHKTEILVEYNKGVGSTSYSKSQSLSWSLDDVITWRIKTGTEDIHEIGHYFLLRYKYWQDYLYSREL